MKKENAVNFLFTLFLCAISVILFNPIHAHAEISKKHSLETARMLKEHRFISIDGNEIDMDLMKEDYLAFVFGRTQCSLTNGTMSALDFAQKFGKSVHKIFIPVDSVDNGLKKYSAQHSGALTICSTDGDNSELSYRLKAVEGLKSSILPTLIILDKKRKVVWSSADYEISFLSEIFKLTPVEGNMTMSYVGPVDIIVNKGQIFRPTIYLCYGPDNATFTPATWYSSNSRVVKVNKNGKCTALKPGKSTIHYKVSSYTKDLNGYHSVIENDYDVLVTVTKERGNIYYSASPPIKIGSLKSGHKQFSLKWSKRYEAEGYQIQYSTTPIFTKSALKTVYGYKNTSALVKKLKPGVTYYVRVRMYFHGYWDSLYYSDWSNIKRVKVK